VKLKDDGRVIRVHSEGLRFLEFIAGDIVEAMWSGDGYWYDAEIQECFTGNFEYEVEFIGFDHVEVVPERFVRKKAIEENEDWNSSKRRSFGLGREGKAELIVNEIIATEQAYLDFLRNLVTVWIEPLEQSCGQNAKSSEVILSEEMMKTLFSNVKLILNLNAKFLKELNEMKKPNVGQIFSHYAPFFKMYVQYVNNYSDAAKLLENLLHSKQFKNFQKFHEETRNSSRSLGLNLQSYLIMPVQRIPRYRLLLTQLIDCTEESDPSLQDLKSALEKISNVAISINENIRQVHNQDEIVKLQSKFIPTLQLVHPGRFLIFKGQLSKLSRKDAIQNYTFFLFNDIILYANTMGWKYVLQCDIPVDSALKIAEHPNTQSNRLLFFSSQKSFTLCPKDQSEKNVWMSHFKEIMAQRKLRSRKDDQECKRALPESISSKPLISWTKDDVFIWLIMNDFDDLLNIFSVYKVDGRKLSKIKETNLSCDMRIPLETSKSLSTSIQALLSDRADEIYNNLKEFSKPLNEELLNYQSDAPKFAKIKDAKLCENELDDERQVQFFVYFNWKNSMGTSKEKQISKTYFEFEQFEKDFRAKYFPNLNVSLKPRHEFLVSFDQRLILERYLQGLTSCKDIYEHLARFLGLSQSDLVDGVNYESKRKNSSSMTDEMNLSRIPRIAPPNLPPLVNISQQNQNQEFEDAPIPRRMRTLSTAIIPSQQQKSSSRPINKNL
jgi:hypothetical protein